MGSYAPPPFEPEVSNQFHPTPATLQLTFENFVALFRYFLDTRCNTGFRRGGFLFEGEYEQ